MRAQFSSVFRLILLQTALLLVLPVLAFASDDRAAERQAMVERQIEARGVSDPATINALRHVPRHLFVPERQRPFAYQDGPLPIGHGQTISQPYMVGYMTEIIHPKPGLKVLEIGTGSGYQAAILAATGAEVFTIEIVSELASSAKQRLKNLGYHNVKVRESDGYFGWPEMAPFDAIIVTAAAEFTPPPLIDQLAEKGLMVIPIGSPFYVQTLMLVQKRNDKPYATSLMPVRFVPFTRAKE